MLYELVTGPSTVTDCHLVYNILHIITYFLFTAGHIVVGVQATRATIMFLDIVEGFLLLLSFIYFSYPAISG